MRARARALRPAPPHGLGRNIIYLVGLKLRSLIKKRFVDLGHHRRGHTRYHPGVLAAKVRDFGSNMLKCPRGQMGTKPAKVGHLAPGAI